MTRSDIRIGFVLVITVILAVVLQFNGLIVIFGIKPAILLGALIAATFFIEQPILYVGLVAVSSFLIRFAPGFSWPTAALAIIALLAFWLHGRILWPGVTGAVVLASGGTLLFNLLTDFSFIYASPFLLIGEIVYTAVITALIFGVFQFFQSRFEHR